MLPMNYRNICGQSPEPKHLISTAKSPTSEKEGRAVWVALQDNLLSANQLCRLRFRLRTARKISALVPHL